MTTSLGPRKPRVRPDRRELAPPGRDRTRVRETPIQQAASFVEFFIWLLVLKTFFLPLFIIPTGSMAETLYGAHGTHVCPNCGFQYAVGFDRAPDRPPQDPTSVRCPNCRWVEQYAAIERRLQPTAGDRIVVHGWPWELGGSFAPRNWDVVVFRNPARPDQNYIKRLIGLPGQRIEIINGDVFVNDTIARKPPHVQDALWFNVYDHDYAPRGPGGRGDYLPRWVESESGSGWQRIDSRSPRFDGIGRPDGAIRFLTTADGVPPACELLDIYAYNARGHRPYSVSDVRLSCDVWIEAGTGRIELRCSRSTDLFVATLQADGRVGLERRDARGGRTTLGSASLGPPVWPVRFALGVVDFSAVVEVDGRRRIEWADDAVTRGGAFELGLAEQRDPQAVARARRVEVAAGDVHARIARLRVERDVYYTQHATNQFGEPLRLRGVAGNPIVLREGEYFVLGDNSPESSDGRFWDHADARYAGTDYRHGTVPRDQLIGRAFFVYWPGFLPLWEGPPLLRIGRLSIGPNLLPNFGELRWIH